MTGFAPDFRRLVGSGERTDDTDTEDIMRDAPTTRGPSSPAARLIRALGLATRTTAEIQDLYTRPIAAVAVVPLDSRRQAAGAPGLAAARSAMLREPSAAGSRRGGGLSASRTGALCSSDPRERGGTGRRAGFRILSRKGSGFDSRRSHPAIRLQALSTGARSAFPGAGVPGTGRWIRPGYSRAGSSRCRSRSLALSATVDPWTTRGSA